jgi:hypothetical protein
MTRPALLHRWKEGPNDEERSDQIGLDGAGEQLLWHRYERGDSKDTSVIDYDIRRAAKGVHYLIGHVAYRISVC